MRVFKNYMWNLSYQLFVLLIPLITIPYISRVLQSEGIGINAYTNSIIQYFILFGSLGFSLYGNREIAYNRNNKEKITEIFWGIFFVRIFTVLISFILLFISTIFFNSYILYILLQSISLLAVIFDISWFFMGMENFKLTVLRNTIIKLLSLILIFIFVKEKSDLWKYILIISMSTLIGNMTLFSYLKEYVNKPNFKTIRFFDHLKYSLVMFIPQVSINIYIILNKTILGFFSDVDQVAYFDSSDRIVKLSLTIVTSLGIVMLPHVSVFFSKKDFYNIEKMVNNSLNFVISISFPLIFGLIAISDTFVPVFFGDGYDCVINLLRLQSMSILFMGISNVLATNYLLPAKMNREYTISVTIGAILSLIFNIPLVLKFGSLGAVITSCISELFVMIYQCFVVRKKIRLNIINIDLLKVVFISIIMFLFVYYISCSFSNSVQSLFIQILVGVLIYLAGMILLKANIIKFLKKIKEGESDK